MSENKGFKILAIVALCVAVAGLSIAYAALSETLNIKTDGSVASQAESWNITFAKDKCEVVTGDSALTTAGNIEVNGNLITTSGAKLGAPGDSIKCTFSVTNNGTMDAEITDVTIGSTATQSNQYAKDNVVYELKDVTKAAAPAIGDALNAKENAEGQGQTRNYEITLTLKPDVTSLPTDALTLDQISSSITYGQV